MNPYAVRKNILELCFEANEGHIASSFSIVEILVSIFLSNQKLSKSISLENIILSKGHAALALYGLMMEIPEYSEIMEKGICKNGSILIGHVPKISEIGLNFGTGSLGHGLPFALGFAFGKAHPSQERVHVIIGDGELNEGTIWESLNILEKFPNLKINVYVDANESSNRAIPMDAAFRALQAGYGAHVIDGHNPGEIMDAITETLHKDRYQIFICKTIKGFPLKCMINNPAWHHRMPDNEDLKVFMKELKDHYEENIL